MNRQTCAAGLWMMYGFIVGQLAYPEMPWWGFFFAAVPFALANERVARWARRR